jgi:outer membrane receptor protein involved in Fe transport
LFGLLPASVLGQVPLAGIEANATLPKLELIPLERNDNALTPFEKTELRRLFGLDLRELARRPVLGVLGYEQEYWRNPASVHVLRPDDISLNGHVLTGEAFRGVPGMHVTRGTGYDDFAIMRNFSGSSTEKFLAMVDGREVLQIMGGTVNATGEGVPLEILDRVEIIRGPGASIWGTNAVSGVYNVVTKSAAATQGDSVRLVIRDDGTFLGDYVHGGQAGENAFYRVWFRDQEYAEGTLNSGLPAKDDGYFRKAGFRYDNTLSRDLDFTFAGALGTRRVHHVLDLSQRLLYMNYDPDKEPDAVDNPHALAAMETFLGMTLPAIVPYAFAVGGEDNLKTLVPSWPISRASATTMPAGLGFTRYEYWGEMPHDAGHLRAKLSGVTDSDLEWTLAGYAEQYKTFLGHVGRRWDRKQYDLDFKANKLIGDRHHLAFGLATRHMNFDVEDVMTPPWGFDANDTLFTPASPNITILDHGDSPTKFDRFSAFFQDSYEFSDSLLLSGGAKFEESDLAGAGVQPGARLSWAVNETNVLWSAYSRAYRTPSLVERYSKVSYARVWVPTSAITGFWLNQSFPGNSDLEKEETDAFEVGWRSQPRDDLTLELSLYHYDTTNAIFSGPPIYEAHDVKTSGGEFTFDYSPFHYWTLKGGASRTISKKEGVETDNFPKTLANVSSHLRLRGDLIFSQNFYYAAERTIPSAYNPIFIPAHLRMDLGFIWRPDESLEIGLFGRDLLDPHHPENMYQDLELEPARVERSFLLSITKRF